MPNDVLKSAGSVTGVVRLRPGHDSRTVFIILLGTTTFSIPTDSIGNFTLENLAEGEYRLRVLSTLDTYKPLDTVLSIQSGVQSRLRDTLRLIYKAPAGELPEIDEVNLEYDTTKISARLTWKKQDAALASAYFVYRKHEDSAFVRISDAPVKDTVFIDDWRSGIQPNEKYAYSVTVLDAKGNEGKKGLAVTLKAAVRYTIDTAISNSACSSGECKYDVDSIGNIYLAESDGTIVRYGHQGTISRWSYPEGGSMLFLRALVAEPSGSNIYVLDLKPLRVWELDSSGNKKWTSNTLSSDGGLNFSFEQSGDTLLVWEIDSRVMVYLDKNGNILKQETSFGVGTALFSTETGFYSPRENGVTLLDQSGHLIFDWALDNQAYPQGLTRDPAGRWYVCEGATPAVDVFSPEYVLIGSIPGTGYGALKYRSGALYLQHHMDTKTLKINVGF